MPSTSPILDTLTGGYTQLPGLQISPYGAILTNLQCFDFTLTDTGFITSTGSTSTNESSYTVSGLSTADLPFSLIPSTGPYGAPPTLAMGLGVGTMRASAANTLRVTWLRTGTATGSITTSTGQLSTLFTIGYYAQTSSTTT